MTQMIFVLSVLHLWIVYVPITLYICHPRLIKTVWVRIYKDSFFVRKFENEKGKGVLLTDAVYVFT